MKKFGVWILKAIAGGVIALLALNAFAMLYYNVPVHYTNPDGAPENKWETSTYYSKGTEGFAWGVTNNDGFNNLRDYTPGERIDILLMGSSHMEGFNIAQDENAGALVTLMQKLPYLRLLYTVQFKGMAGAADADDTEAAEAPAALREPAAALSPLLGMAADICSARGVQPIIVFDPAVYVDGQGNAYTETDAGCLAAFESVCAEHGIVFVDLTDAYTGEYAESCQLP